MPDIASAEVNIVAVVQSRRAGPRDPDPSKGGFDVSAFYEVFWERYVDAGYLIPKYALFISASFCSSSDVPWATTVP